MFFGLFKSKPQIETQASVPEGPIRNHRLENAINNFLKLVKGNNLLINQEALRLGSLSIIAHSSKDEILNAMGNLKSNGSIQSGQEASMTQEIIKLLSSNELKLALNRKLSKETGMSIDHFRTVATKLAQAKTDTKLAA